VIQAKVLNVSRAEKKIGLSIRKLEESSEKEIFKSYMESNKGATSNLGDLLREEMIHTEQPTQSETAESHDGERPETESDTQVEPTDSSPEKILPEDDGTTA